MSTLDLIGLNKAEYRLDYIAFICIDNYRFKLLLKGKKRSYLILLAELTNSMDVAYQPF